MSEEVAIGIDLGTSNSCVATVDQDRPRVIPNAFGERTSASVVSFAEDGSIGVGNQAKARVILDPKHTVSSAKRLIGRYFFSEEVRKARAIYRYEILEGPSNSVRIKIRENVYSLPEISALVLKAMKQAAEQDLGRPVSKAVITVPAYFNDNQRQSTKDAGRIAGLEVLRILNEPTAAALAYGYGRDIRQRVVVYDLGGGTFDVSVLEIGGDVFEVLSTCGDTFLGGDDFDDRIIDLLAEQFQASHNLNVRTDPFAFEKLKAAAENAKIQLSEKESVKIEIPALATVEGEQLGIEAQLTRSQFAKLVNDLIQRTFKVCDEALQQAGLTVRDLEGVILVGGPTRLPTIREAVEAYFQREADADVNPDEVVAVGAAIHASALVEQKTDTCLLDITPLSLRIGIAGGMTDTIIERNTPVPIDHTRSFTTVKDFQDSVSVRVFQGECRAAEDNELLGEFEFSGFQPGPREQVKIDVTFAISTEGIVHVSACDPRTGAEQSATISMSSGLSEDEIAAIIARGQQEEKARGAPPPFANQSRDPGPSALPVEEELILDTDNDEGPEELGATTPDADDELFGSMDSDLPEED